MPTLSHPSALAPIEPGHVYRLRELVVPGVKNPSRAVSALVRSGALVRLQPGLFAAPRPSRWGPVLPSDEALLNATLGEGNWILSGPPRWSALGLGVTAQHAVTWVTNRRRSGPLQLGGRRFALRLGRFPKDPPPEWFVVELFSHAATVGLSLSQLTESLRRALAAGRFDRATLRRLARDAAPRREVLRSLEAALA